MTKFGHPSFKNLPDSSRSQPLLDPALDGNRQSGDEEMDHHTERIQPHDPGDPDDGGGKCKDTQRIADLPMTARQRKLTVVNGSLLEPQFES